MKTLKPSPELTALLSGTLTVKEAREIYDQGRDAVVRAILALQKRVDELSSGSASGSGTLSKPSSTIPPYEKPPNKRRARKSGAKPGHQGHRRADPEPDEIVEKTLDRCPECGGEVTKCRSASSTRSRIIEDISPEPKVKVTKRYIHGYWRRHCQKVVEPKVAEALPCRRIGNNTIAMTAHLHYGLGSTTSQIFEILNYHFSVNVTPGALFDLWKCAAEILTPWYEEIRSSCLSSGVLHADESGWRVNGIRIGCGVPPRKTKRIT